MNIRSKDLPIFLRWNKIAVNFKALSDHDGILTFSSIELLYLKMADLQGNKRIGCFVYKAKSNICS